MIRVGIVGISGYSGFALLKILLGHPQVRLMYVSASQAHGPVDKIWPQLQGRTRLSCEKFNADRAAESCDVVFLAVPHTVSMTIMPALRKRGVRVIDLSGDYRLDSASVYKKWYKTSHRDTRALKRTVYGLPEIYRAKIAKASAVANPGCYPTAALLALAPVVSLYSSDVGGIIIDAKSGVSGAGKKPAPQLMAAEVLSNFKAYKMLAHQHTPEIDQYLSSISGEEISVTFTPHLLPIHSGIYETIYIQMADTFDQGGKLQTVYRKFYKTEPFVRVMPKGDLPEIKNVVGTNYCDTAVSYDRQKNMIILTAAIDNLIKGAAGQAVQNMNIMFNFSETSGLL
ncbi:MAG: N-acetyl-gamma-glutamyl-phosphate reductase [Candidatus Omnitrophota bacterium]